MGQTAAVYEVRRRGDEIVEISEAGDRRDARILKLWDQVCVRRNREVIEGPITQILDPERAEGPRIIRIGEREWATPEEIE